MDLQFGFGLVMEKNVALLDDAEIGNSMGVAFKNFWVVGVLVGIRMHISYHISILISKDDLLPVELYAGIEHFPWRFHFYSPSYESKSITVGRNVQSFNLRQIQLSRLVRRATR